MLRKSLNGLYKFIIGIIVLFSLLILVYLCFFSTLSTADMLYNMDEVTFFTQDNILFSFIGIIFFIALTYCLTTFLERFKLKYLFVISSLLITFLMIFLIADINLLPTWDAFKVIKAGVEFGQGNYEMMTTGGYIYEYPFQISIVLYFWLLSSLFGKNYIAFQLVNLCFLIGTYYFMVKTVRLHSTSKKPAILLILFITLFFPMHMYALFLYSNVPAAFFLILGIYLISCYFLQQNLKFILFSFVALSVATLFKGTSYIAVIAFLILLFLDYLKTLSYKPVLLALLSTTLLLTVPTVLNMFVSSKSEAININNDIYTEIALVMGTSWGPRGAGWHSGWYEPFLYETYNHDTVAMKKDGMNRFVNNLETLVSNSNEFTTFFSNKIGSMWVNPEFQGFWTIQANKNEQWGTGDKEAQSLLFINYNPLNDHYGYFTGSFMLGNLNQLIRIYLNIFQNIIYFFTLYYVVENRNKLNPIRLLNLLTFLGGFLFLLVWEAKAQYSILFFILLLPLAAQGLFSFHKRCSTWFTKIISK